MKNKSLMTHVSRPMVGASNKMKTIEGIVSSYGVHRYVGDMIVCFNSSILFKVNASISATSLLN